MSSDLSPELLRVVVDGPEALRLERFELPGQPAAGFARVRVRAIGICGSDLHVLAGHHPFVTYPVFPGHELLGVVHEVGSGATGEWVGKRVVLEPSLACGRCDACLRGDYNICENLLVMGFQAPGGMADVVDVPIDRLHIVPSGLSDDAAVLAEPTAVATHALRRAEETSGSLDGCDVTVLGAGTIGLLVGQAARAAGARVTLVDPDPDRRTAADSLGLITAETPKRRSYDVAFECGGAEAAIRTGIDSVRKGGLVIVVGVHGSDARIQVGLIQDNELRVIGSLMYTKEDYVSAFELLLRGDVAADRMISEHLKLAEARKGYELARSGGATLKVVLQPE